MLNGGAKIQTSDSKEVHYHLTEFYRGFAENLRDNDDGIQLLRL